MLLFTHLLMLTATDSRGHQECRVTVGWSIKEKKKGYIRYSYNGAPKWPGNRRRLLLLQH